MSADHTADITEELDRLRAVEKAAYEFADDLNDYCSPYGVSAQYAQELRERLKAAARRGSTRSERR